MLAANETVAEGLFLAGDSILYTVRMKHQMRKNEETVTFINNFGYHIHIGRMRCIRKKLQKLLERIEGTPEEADDLRLALRSMKQADIRWIMTDISDWQRSITAILLHRSAAIRICRSTGLSKIIFEAG